MPMDNASSMSLLDEMGTKSGTLGGGFQGFFQGICRQLLLGLQWLNGLWSPFGFETDPSRPMTKLDRYG